MKARGRNAALGVFPRFPSAASRRRLPACETSGRTDRMSGLTDERDGDFPPPRRSLRWRGFRARARRRRRPRSRRRLRTMGEQSVFASEAEGAARIVARQYGHGGRIIVRANTERRGEATEENLRGRSPRSARDGPRARRPVPHSDFARRSAGHRRRHAERKVLHHADRIARNGARERRAAQRRRRFRLLFRHIRRRARRTRHARHHRGGRRPPLLRLPRDGAKWTAFGEAFFHEALAETKSLPDAFALARSRIAAREQAEGYDPSNPQMAGGAACWNAWRAARRLAGTPCAAAQIVHQLFLVPRQFERFFA